MNKTARRTPALALGMFLLLCVFSLTTQTHLTAAVECVGKLYGYPSCPTRPATGASSSGGATTCGDAIVDPGEQCDKGRFNGRTDCGLDCRTLYCGDGIISRDIDEECEPEMQEVYVQDKNGNLTTEVQFSKNKQCGWYCLPPSCSDGGKCTGGCMLQYIGACAASGTTLPSESTSLASTGSTVTSVDSASSSVPPLLSICGNGVIEGVEKCDDGNKDLFDGCGNTCVLPFCGDGIVQAGEECDAADRNSDTMPDACRTNCLLYRCGDSVTDNREQCDGGIQNSDRIPDACRTSCKSASCGDGIRDSGEDCDDGNRSDIDDCTVLCKLPACGDGVVQPNEECDWGKKNSSTSPDACRTTCKLPVCGDDVVDTGEQCDGTPDCQQNCTLHVVDHPASSTGAQVIAPPPPSPSPPAQLHPAASANDAPVLAVVAMAVALSSGILFFFRKKVFGLLHLKVKGGGKALDLDDIPLDQIEMPWHKW